jgi:phosphopantothenoylcysteine decarboxylase/phosphopantothenate--cysteine ligase
VTTARELLDRVGLAFVVGNDASVMGEADTHAFVIRAAEKAEYVGHKAGLGEYVAQELATELN